MRWLFVILIFLSLAIVLVYAFPGFVYQSAMALERKLAGLQTKTLTLPDGVNVVYSDGGAGEVLVLLHGFTADRDNWTRTARFLTDRYRVIAPDLPGFGQSSRETDRQYTIEAQLLWLEAFLAGLEVDQVHLGGSSMGGNIAANFARRHPDRVRSLWLLAPGGVVTAEQSDMERALRAGKPHPLVPSDRAGFEDTLDFVFAARPFLPGPLRRYLAMDAGERHDLRLQIFDDILDDERTGIEPLLDDGIRGLMTPTLIVWGDQDRVLHPSGADVLGALLPRSEIEIMPGAGHLPMLEQPKAVASRYIGFREQRRAR